MPRLTDNCFATIQNASHNRIVELIQCFLPLKRSGQNWECCCPFHTEKTPSFKVSITKHRFKCFGCPEEGDGIDFVEKHLKLETFDAMIMIANKLNIPIEYVE